MPQNETVDPVVSDLSIGRDPPLTQWTAIAALATGVFALVSAEFLPAGSLTPMAAGLGTSIGSAGQAVTATAAFGAFAALSTPLVATQIERRVLLWSLMALLFVSDALTAAAVNLPMLFVARALLGLCVGSFWSLAGAVVVRLASAGAFPRAMSVPFTGVSLATVLAAPTAAYVASLWGWRTGYELATALAGLAALFQVFTVPRLGRGKRRGLERIQRSYWPSGDLRRSRQRAAARRRPFRRLHLHPIPA
jgi:DHA1 family purine ribonucleoside efflux pump-like MFS transporter